MLMPKAYIRSPNYEASHPAFEILRGPRIRNIPMGMNWNTHPSSFERPACPFQGGSIKNKKRPIPPLKNIKDRQASKEMRKADSSFSFSSCYYICQLGKHLTYYIDRPAKPL